MIDIIITVAVCVALFVGALRHAKNKPNGKTARWLQTMVGGGPGTPDEK